MSDEHGMPAGGEGPAEDVSGPATAPVEPMTSGLMARLFVVPAIVVSVMVGVAVVVVLFGASSVSRQRTIPELLSVLEKGDGQRQIPFALLPDEKAYWQAAETLSKRLSRGGSGLAEEEIAPTVERLVVILDKLSGIPQETTSSTLPRHFLMLSLARIGAPRCVASIAARLDDASPVTRRVALQCLAEMGSLAEARALLPRVLERLDDEVVEVRMVACAAVASLAERGDPAAIRALTGHLESEREMSWNAAMTLARLGSARGAMVLENMLQREFWDGVEIDYEENGARIQRKYTDVEISNNLIAAIQAAAMLEAPGLTRLVGALREDESHAVQAAALAASRPDDPAGSARLAPSAGTLRSEA